MNTFNDNRRNFLKNAGALALGSTLPSAWLNRPLRKAAKTSPSPIFPMPIFSILSEPVLSQTGIGDLFALLRKPIC